MAFIVNALVVLADFWLSLSLSTSIFGRAAPPWGSGRPVVWIGQSMAMAPASLYWLVPVGMWYQFGLSRKSQNRSRWPRIRSRITQLFVPVALWDYFVIAGEFVVGHPGFLAFFVGVSLIALGYMQLHRHTDHLTAYQTLG